LTTTDCGSGSAVPGRQPTLTIERHPRRRAMACVRVRKLHPDLIASLRACARAGQLPRSVLRVRVMAAEGPEGEDLPDVFGRHQVVQDGVRFIPHFPFAGGVRFRATFDPRPLGRPDSERLTLEFSLPRKTSMVRAQVQRVFPSGDSLPENLLRFHACFSAPMQRGQALDHITLLGPDGRPAPDVLYRPPVELWDRSMTDLTILLDPGRIKRGLGPNRALGPPLRAGQQYTLAIGPGMVDRSGRALQSCYKSFHVTAAIREPIAVERWQVVVPPSGSRAALELLFPHPLDWALLPHAITIASAGGRPMDGRIAIDQGERRWSFAPNLPWSSGAYRIRVASSLEDVCGNGLRGAFDRALRSAADAAREVAGDAVDLHFRLPRCLAPPAVSSCAHEIPGK